MNSKLKSIALFILLILLLFTSCDPGHGGTRTLSNNTSETLIIKYSLHSKDTTITISPYSSNQFSTFGGLGAGSGFNCCSCEFDSISLQPKDTSKNVTKSISETEQWIMINTNKKKYDYEKISCEFYI